MRGVKGEGEKNMSNSKHNFVKDVVGAGANMVFSAGKSFFISEMKFRHWK